MTHFIKQLYKHHGSLLTLEGAVWPNKETIKIENFSEGPDWILKLKAAEKVLMSILIKH